MGPVATSSGEQFSLEDRYRREAGAVYVTGIQALVRMLLDRARADQRAGRATATYVTGYEAPRWAASTSNWRARPRCWLSTPSWPSRG